MGQLIFNRKCYQVSKPEMELHMINIIYAASTMHAKTEKTTFSCKDNQCKTFWSGVKGLVHCRSTCGAGHIPLCGIFSLHAAQSALRHFFRIFFAASEKNQFSIFRCHLGCATHAQIWAFFSKKSNTPFLLLYYSVRKLCIDDQFSKELKIWTN